MEKTKPLVTVLIASFNTGPYLKDTLESVRVQTMTDFEVIMVDDGSSDNTPDIMNHYAEVDPRFKAIVLPVNGGVVAARNIGLTEAQGDWIAILDGDDLWTVDALQHRLELVDLYPTVDVVATEFTWFYDEVPSVPCVGQVSKGPRARAAFADAYQGKTAQFMEQPFELLATLHFAWTGAMLIRRKAIFAAGNFDTNFKGPEDTLLWLRLALRGPFVFSPYVSAFYRQRSGSLVTTYKGPKELHYIPVLEHLLKDTLTAQQYKIVNLVKAECHYVAAVYFRISGLYYLSLKHNLDSIKFGVVRFYILKQLIIVSLQCTFTFLYSIVKGRKF